MTLGMHERPDAAGGRSEASGLMVGETKTLLRAQHRVEGLRSPALRLMAGGLSALDLWISPHTNHPATLIGAVRHRLEQVGSPGARGRPSRSACASGVLVTNP